MIPQPLQPEKVVVSNGQWKQEMKLQVRDLTQWTVRELWLHNNYRATIINEIAHIHFTALTCISLGSNRIESVEGLSRMQMPSICILNLYGNSIRSVGVMRKSVWPALQELNIMDNYFKDANSLAQSCFPQMHTLYTYNQWEDKNKFTEQCFLGKMQASSLTQLCINTDKFCFDRSISRVLQQRWADVYIE